MARHCSSPLQHSYELGTARGSKNGFEIGLSRVNSSTRRTEVTIGNSMNPWRENACFTGTIRGIDQCLTVENHQVVALELGIIDPRNEFQCPFVALQEIPGQAPARERGACFAIVVSPISDSRESAASRHSQPSAIGFQITTRENIWRIFPKRCDCCGTCMVFIAIRCHN